MSTDSLVPLMPRVNLFLRFAMGDQTISQCAPCLRHSGSHASLCALRRESTVDLVTFRKGDTCDLWERIRIEVISIPPGKSLNVHH